MKNILFMVLTASLLSSCAAPQKKIPLALGEKAGTEKIDSSEAAPLPPDIDVSEASLRGAGFEVDPDIKPVRFDYDSAHLSVETLNILKANAAILKTRRDSEFLVSGHCDDRGTVAYNLALGQKRAKEVRDYYIRLGVDGGRVATISYGKEQPECSDATEACRSKSRRAVTGVRTKTDTAAQ